MNLTLSSVRKAVTDLYKGLENAPLWLSLSYQETKQRYRRSILGPLWITLSTGVLVAAMGPIYGTLLGQDVASYLQYLAISLILWMFIAGSITEAGTIFIGADNLIKQIALPFSVHVFRALSKGAIMFAHNALIIVVVLIFLPPAHWHNLWMFPLGLLLVLGNLFWVSFLVAIISTRFRDIPQIVASLIQVSFFLTPVIWKVDMIGPQRSFVVDFNPFYHLLEVVRGPLLGQPTHMLSWIIAASMLAVGSVGTLLVFARLRSRIPYWL